MKRKHFRKDTDSWTINRVMNALREADVALGLAVELGTSKAHRGGLMCVRQDDITRRRQGIRKMIQEMDLE